MPMKFRSSPVFAVAVICVAIFTDNLAYGVLIPVLPAILLQNPSIPDADVNGWLSYTLALYGLTLLIFSPIFGYVSDHYWSRRTLLLVGLIMMAISLVLLMICTSSTWILVAARASQGASSAAVGVGGLALISDTVGARNAALGSSFSVASVFLSAAVGPFLGGVLYDNVGYYAVLAVPTGLIVLSMILLVLIKDTTKYADEDDHESVASADHDQSNPSWATDHLAVHPASEHDPLLPSADGDLVTNTTIFEHQDRSIFDLVRGARMMNAVFCLTICVSIFAAFEVTLPLFSLMRFSWSPTKTGLLLLVCSAPKAVSPLAGKLVDRYGARYPTAIALVTSLCCMICLCFVRDDSPSHKALLITCLTLNNTAAAVTETAMIGEITIIARVKGLAAQGGALVNVALASGLMLGPLIGGLMYQHFDWQGFALSLGLLWLICLPGTMRFALNKQN